MKAKVRRNPAAQTTKLLNRFLATRKLRSKTKKAEGLSDVEARAILLWLVQTGKVTAEQYHALREHMLPDDHYSILSKKRKRMDSEASSEKKTAPGELPAKSS